MLGHGQIWGKHSSHNPEVGPKGTGNGVDGCEMSILTDTMNGTEAQKKTILHHVYAYKGLNSPKLRTAWQKAHQPKYFYSLQSSTATGPDLLWTAVPPFPPRLRISPYVRLLRLPDLDILDRSTCL